MVEKNRAPAGIKDLEATREYRQGTRTRLDELEISIADAVEEALNRCSPRVILSRNQQDVPAYLVFSEFKALLKGIEPYTSR